MLFLLATLVFSPLAAGGVVLRPDDRLGVVAIPKTGTRSVEVFISRHLPVVIGRNGGCLYALDCAKNRDNARWPASSAFLAPQPEGEGGQRANADLFLFHANTHEMMKDWREHRRAFGISAGALYTTTVLRDPLDRLVSEFFFGLEFKLQDKWATGATWRRQFWGARDFSDLMLQQLNSAAAKEAENRLEFFADQAWLPAHNRQTRFLAGEADPSRPVTRDTLERAKHNLAQLTVVGLTEDLDTYFSCLACTFPVNSTLYPEVERTPWRRESVKDNVGGARKKQSDVVTDAVRDAVRVHSWADYELYTFAQALVQAQVKQGLCSC